MFPFSIGFNMFSMPTFFSGGGAFSFLGFSPFNYSLFPSFSSFDYSFDFFDILSSSKSKSSSKSRSTKKTHTKPEAKQQKSYSPSSVLSNAKSYAQRTYQRLLKSARDGYGKPFLDKVKQIAKEINCDYRDLLAIMNSESGIDASRPCSDSSSSAVGLIQFTKVARDDLHVTRAQLLSMSPIQQLDYVKNFYLRWKKIKGYGQDKQLSAGELYALTYTPGYLKKNSNVLTRSGMVEYDKNKGLDMNKDGYITVDDLTARVNKFAVSDDSFLA